VEVVSRAVIGRQRRALLEWYEPRRFAYPWRRTRDPYPILLSEVMLQQTQASRVVPAYERFLAALPSLDRLAAASVASVIREWDGLGYNRRAVAISRAARAIVSAHDGVVPRDPAALRSLPGVGPYTAAAVASIAYGVPVAAIDTNVRRVVSRVWATVPGVVDRAATVWLDPFDPGGWNQAVMDLGREVCRPRPRCTGCPLAPSCRSAGSPPRVEPARAASPFEGSARQVRGAVVRELRRSARPTLASLSAAIACDVDVVASAVRALHADGLVVAGPLALRGRSTGHVRLP
jgi:A/G-specific adenine glycosylase